MCYVTHVKDPSSLIEKRRGSPWCSWSERKQAPQHLVKYNMVLSKDYVSLQEILLQSQEHQCEAHVCCIRSHNYYYLHSNNLFDYGLIYQEAKQKAYKREQRQDRKRKADDDDLDSGVDPDMVAMMGFSGFGGAKK